MWVRAYLGVIIFAICSTTAHAITVTDDLGVLVQINHPVQRVISLAPDITEVLFAIGAGGKLVGVMKGSDFPLAAKKIPVVGSYAGLDLERIIALHPDLIVTWGQTFSRSLGVLKKMGIPVYTTQPKQLDDVAKTMTALGQLTGTSLSAVFAIQTYRQQLQALQQRYHDEPVVTVFYQLSDYGLMTVNRDSWINQVITLCRGRNIFAHLKTTAPEVSWEAVVVANPQVILASAANDQWKDRWQRWVEVMAVRQQALYTVSPDLIERASPRLINGIERVCQVLHTARH